MLQITEISKRWYVRPNDLIGGWCITIIDKPPSEINPCEGVSIIGEFLGKELSEHIVTLHNNWLSEVSR